MEEEIQKVEQNGNRPEDWLELLAKVRAHSAPQHVLHLFGRAVCQIPAEENRKNSSYAQLLLDYAKLQEKTCSDAARSIYQLARSNATRFAKVHVAWAEFELSQGNSAKCRKLLRKAKEYGAEPTVLLQKAYEAQCQGKKKLLDEEKAPTEVFIHNRPSESGSSPESLINSSTDDNSINLSSDSGSVISFKLPSVVKNRASVQRKHLNGSSSSDDTDTQPFVAPMSGSALLSRQISMSAHKPTVSQTPNVKTAEKSLAGNLNLSVRRPGARRGLASSGRKIGLPQRVRVSTVDDSELEGIQELDATELGNLKEKLPSRDEELGAIKEIELKEEVKIKPAEKTESAHIKQLNTNGSVGGQASHIGPVSLDMHQSHGAQPCQSGLDRQSHGGHPSYSGPVSLDRHLYQGHSVTVNAAGQSPGVQPSHSGLDRHTHGEHSSSVNTIGQSYGGHSGSVNFTGQSREAQPSHSGLDRHSYSGSVNVTGQSHRGYNGPVNSGGQSLGGHSGTLNVNGQSHGGHSGTVNVNGQSHRGNLPQFNGQQPGNSSSQGAAGMSGYLSYSGHMSSGTLISGYLPQMQFVHPQASGLALPQNTITVNGRVYQTQGTIGKGGSSKVFRAFDGERICAVKQVCLEDADERMVQSHINEINLLKRLQGKDNIIKMFDWEMNVEENVLWLVMECGSIDLAGYLRKNRSKITEWEVRSYWRQMLEAVRVIHEEGIIHTDLKPANFLFVEGQLKLIDFGIANAIQDDKTSIERDAQVGTLNFMSPESIEDISHGASSTDPAARHKPRMKIGRPSDVWSLGCILYAMVYGKTPFQHITRSLIKLQCIMDPSHSIDFPAVENDHLLDVMKGCLHRDPRVRYTIPQMLKHPFITRTETSQAPVVGEDQLFSFLMDFSKSAVNSPRSVRAISKALHDKLHSGGFADISSVVTTASQHASRPAQAPFSRKPLVDVQSLQQAQKDLKALSVSGSSKYMGVRSASDNKENSNLESLLRQGLKNKYKNALPAETPDSTFDQSWSTTTRS